MEPATSLRHRLEFLSLRGLQTVVRGLPERWALTLGSGAARLAGRLGSRADLVRENLERAFPEAPQSWVEQVRTETLSHMGSELTTLLRVGGRSPEALRDFVAERTSWMADGTSDLFAKIKADRERGRGTLVITGHLGNWEIAGAALVVRGLPLEAVAVRQKNPLVHHSLKSQREAFGMRVIDRDASPRAVPDALRAGRAVALVADQHTAGGIVVPFFGHPALTPKGPAVFARRTGVRVVVGGAVVRGRDPRRYEVFLEEVDPVPEGAGKDEVIREFTRRFTHALERRIREDPEQYMWLHRRWRRAVLEDPQHSESARD